jgi:hypothetical protein
MIYSNILANLREEVDFEYRSNLELKMQRKKDIDVVLKEHPPET